MTKKTFLDLLIGSIIGAVIGGVPVFIFFGWKVGAIITIAAFDIFLISLTIFYKKNDVVWCREVVNSTEGGQEGDMKKIIAREITNEDGDFYGVVGDITRLGAYRAIRQDLDSWGILEDMEFKAEDLEQFDFYETIECPSGEHEGWQWWGTPDKEDKTKYLGKGWGYKI